MTEPPVFDYSSSAGPVMQLYLPSKEEAAELLRNPRRFRDLAICDGALPPAFILKAAIEPQNPDWLMPRLFYDQLSGQVVGSGGFKSEPRERTIEIGYGVSPARQRLGYATQAVLLLVKEAFSSGVIDAVTAQTAKSNVASRRVLEKAGFTFAGSGTDSEGPVDLWVQSRRSSHP